MIFIVSFVKDLNSEPERMEEGVATTYLKPSACNFKLLRELRCKVFLEPPAVLKDTFDFLIYLID